MAISGDLQDLDLFNLIQILSQDQRSAQISIMRGNQEAHIFMNEGNIVHALVDDLQGEEAIFRLVTWEQGQFAVERPAHVPTQTIFTNWSGLLLEGMRRLDEARPQDDLNDVFDTLTEPDRPESLTAAEEALWPKQALFSELLQDLVASDTDVESAVLLSSDGLSLAAESNRSTYEPAKIAALAAGLMGMGQRSAHQLNQEQVDQIIVKADLGYLLIVRITTHILLVGIMPAQGNLGMALFEMNTTRQRLQTTLA
jgi:predicted regulator of Ras-like GTPase activity (Roadblock/LC7/MglB family)